MYILVDNKREVESDSKREIVKAVKELLTCGKGCTIQVVVGSTVRHNVPPVGVEAGPDQLPDTPQHGDLPKRMRKERSDKGKKRKR